MVEFNTLIFDDIVVEEDFRGLLKHLFKKDSVFGLFNKEINLVAMDYDLKKEIDLPAVTIEVFQSRSLFPDDVELQTYTPFTVEINVYTSGKNKIKKNKQLSNEIIKIMQSNGDLKHYYCRGLMLEENREVGSIVDSDCRRLIRMSGLCDNRLKLITRR